MTPPSSLFLYFLLISLPILLLHAAAHPHHGRQSLTSYSGAHFNCPSVSPELASSHFNVLVPNRTSFKQLVDCSEGPENVKGFVIDVFEAARLILPPDSGLTPCANVSYHCFDLSSGQTFDDMVECLLLGSFDAVVGDVTITANRSMIASFTLPYLDSGIVVLAPAVRQTSTFPGIFLAPFTAQMWWTICACVVFTGFVLWSLEHNAHPKFRQGPPKQQIQKVLWFIASLMVFLKRDSIKNPLSKAVLVSWIAFVLVLGSAYIATLSAILTVQKMSPENLTMSTLQNGTIKIGYRPGTNAADYLVNRLNISKNRLVSLFTPDDYGAALSKGPHKNGGRVAAIVDEVPYVNLFLSGLTTADCVYVIVNSSSKLTSEGFGFAFPMSSRSIPVAFSKAILNLSENGQSLKLQTGAMLSEYNCPTQVQSTQLDLKISEGLFLFLGLMLLTSIGILSAKLMRRCIQNRKFSKIRMPSQQIGTGLCHVDDNQEENSILHRKSREFTSESSAHYLTRQETFS